MSKLYPTASPCKGCTDRHPTCHASCQQYIDWQHSGVEQDCGYYYNTPPKQYHTIFSKLHDNKHKGD